MKYLLIFASFMILLNCRVSAQIRIASKDASKHIGEMVTFDDIIYDTKMANDSAITQLRLGENYSNRLLTVMINNANCNKINKRPELFFKGQNVRITGKVTSYKGKPVINVSSADQLKINLSDNIVL